MKRNMILLFIFLICLAVPTPALAQANITLDSLQVAIFPEYDRTDVLVIYRITLPAEQALPAELTFRLPQGVDEPYNVAMQDVDGMLYNLDYYLSYYTTGNTVTFTALSQHIQIEYYDGHMTTSSQERQFEYHWPGDYSVDDMSIILQQPATATRFQVIPDMGSSEVSDDHLTYYTLDVGEVQKGIKFSVRLNYDKPDNVLSINSQSVQPVQPIPQDAPIGSLVQNEGMVPWLMGGLCALFLIGGGLWYYRSGHGKKKRYIPQPNGKTNGKGRQTEELMPIYCHQCGKKAKTGDLFCRACGTKLKY